MSKNYAKLVFIPKSKMSARNAIRTLNENFNRQYQFEPHYNIYYTIVTFTL